MRKLHKSGFTLIELLIVTVVVVSLMAVMFRLSGIAGNTSQRETTVRRENHTFFVEGEWLRNLLGQINFEDRESIAFFQRILLKEGVIDRLREAGIEEEDIVNIYDFEFEFLN